MEVFASSWVIRRNSLPISMVRE